MKLLIISDLHLTTNFIKKKFNFLNKIISASDKVIINGDFWSAYYNTFDEFVNSPWNRLFPLLKSRGAIYIYGNHDRKNWCDARVNLFSIKQADEYKFKYSDKLTLLFNHGHKYLGDSVSNEKFMSFWRKYKIDVIKYLFESLFLRIFGRFIYYPARLLNKKIKERVGDLGNDIYLVTGHTHWRELDLKNRFLNSGIIHAGVASYIVIENGEIKAVSARY